MFRFILLASSVGVLVLFWLALCIVANRPAPPRRSELSDSVLNVTTVMRLVGLAMYIEHSRHFESINHGRYPFEEELVVRGTRRLVLPARLRKINEDPMAAMRSFSTMHSERDFYEAYYTGSKWRREDLLIQYISNGEWFILISCGPDRAYEQEWILGLARSKSAIPRPTIGDLLIQAIYDPTNGARSQGDIFVTSPDLGLGIDDIGDRYSIISRRPLSDASKAAAPGE